MTATGELRVAAACKAKFPMRRRVPNVRDLSRIFESCSDGASLAVVCLVPVARHRRLGPQDRFRSGAKPARRKSGDPAEAGPPAVTQSVCASHLHGTCSWMFPPPSTPKALYPFESRRANVSDPTPGSPLSATSTE